MKNKFFLIVTFATIASTRIAASETDNYWNPFVESNSSHVLPDNFVSTALGYVSTTKEVAFSAKDRIQEFFNKCSESPVSNQTPAIIPVLVVDTTAAIAKTQDVIAKESSLQQWKNDYLRPVAIISSMIIVALGVHQAYLNLTQEEESKAVVQDQQTTEIN